MLPGIAAQTHLPDKTFANEGREAKPRQVNEPGAAAPTRTIDEQNDQATNVAGRAAAISAGLHAPVRLTQTPSFSIDMLQIEPLTRQISYADGARETLEPRVM